MAKKSKSKSGRRRRPSKKTSVIVGAGLFAGMYEGVRRMLMGDKDGVVILVENYTGYNMNDRSWSPGKLIRGYGPLVTSVVISKVVGKEVNKQLALPYVKA